MSKTTPHIVIIIAFLFSSFICFAQMDVSVKATINRNKIMIGEPIELKLEANFPTGTDAKWFVLDSMQHFEFIDKGKIDTISSSDVKTYRQTLTITSFDSGRWSVPSLAFTIGNKDYLTDSLPVSVAYSNFDPKQDYHDIKDIIEVENSTLKYINWAILALAILSLSALIYFLRKKDDAPKPVVIKKSAIKLSPLQEALQAIDILQKKYTAQKNAKTFHTELNNIFRQYLYRKTNVTVMEKTSGELMMQLKQFNLPVDEFTILAQTLRLNDAVKFAKYQPAENENQEATGTIKKSVEKLDTIIENK